MENEGFCFTKLELRNFTGFKKFECQFNDKVTTLIGVNGSGKTTIGLKAIWAVFHGIASRGKGIIGDRFQFIGDNGRSADISLTIKDIQKNVEIVLNRHITKKTTTIEFEAPKGYAIDESWFKNLLNVSFLSARHFTALTSKEQAKCLGIDTSEFDKKIKEQKAMSKILRKEVADFGNIEEVEFARHESISDLIAQRDKMVKFNLEQAEKNLKISTLSKTIIDDKGELEKLLVKVDKLKTKILNDEHILDAIDLPLELQDISIFDDKIKNLEVNNLQASLYKEFSLKEDLKSEKEMALLDSKDEEGKILREKREYISSLNLGFDDLSINEDGELLLKDRPITENFFSRGQLEIIVAELYASQNPLLKVRFIDEISVLDDENREKIIKSLLDKGFQIILAGVGKKKIDSNTILLKECESVDQYPSENNLV